MSEIPAPDRTAWLVRSGDLREAANVAGWPAQQRLEADLAAALETLGWTVRPALGEDPALGHGFVRSQRMGMDVFAQIPQDAPVIVATAIWQYSHHVLPGLRTHRGPILTVANFSGEWPGLVGLLNLNGGLTKMGKEYSTLWSVDFSDRWALDRLAEWTSTGRIVHDESHVRPLGELSGSAAELGVRVAETMRRRKAILGVFDEGCMGMYNAIIDDELLNPLGMFKERLSQSALYAEMRTVTKAEKQAVHDWLTARGMRFRLGTDHATELTREQLDEQYAMYVAVLRIADDFGLDAVGIQYQQGLKDLVAASDLVEGLLNSTDRPPVLDREGERELYAGRALTHFNEVDEGAAVDGLLTHLVWSELGLLPDNTLHDVRWGEQIGDDFVWVLEISGAVPASHLGGYDQAEGWRQSPVFFPAGGSTINGVSKPGEVVWSRVYVADGGLHVDLGRGRVLELSEEDTQRRKRATNEEWPVANTVFYGIDRDQFMARNKANHVQLVYATDASTADRALTAKAAAFDHLGVTVHLCGDVTLAP